MKNNKFTFRKQNRITGLAGVGYPIRNVDIKLNNRIVGVIHAPNWQKYNWNIWLSVLKADINENRNLNCHWKNVKLKFIPESEENAREFLQKNIDKILERYMPYCVETEEFYLDGEWNKIK